MTNSYTVLSPIKVGGKICAIGERIELPAALVATLPPGRVKVVGDEIDELLEKTPSEILEAAETLPFEDLNELGRREHAKGAQARQGLLGGLMVLAGQRQEAEARARDQERAKADEEAKADAEAKAKAEAEAKTKAEAEAAAKDGKKAGNKK